ncbi:TAXI family TRAP transporter solute-binding subunit [Thiolapillus sp.]
MTRHKRNWKEQLSVYGPLALLVLAGFVWAYQHIKPAPPDHIIIASGEKGGAYYAFARRYGELLKEQGIQLEIVNTRGSVENLELLNQGSVDLAFVQGGVNQGNLSTTLEGLGSLYYEPLWLFHQSSIELHRIPGLQGLRVATGPEGSGTQVLVKLLLKENALRDASLELLPLESAEAADGLREGSLDAAFFVASPQSELVSGLLHDPSIRLASFERAHAYARRHDFLSVLTLPEGAEDLAANIPSQEVQLLAAASNLVVREGMHPGLVSLLMQIIDKVHRPAGWFSKEGEFPNSRYLSFPLNEQAERYYRHGPPFLQRYLPFWAASLLDRMKIMILPLLGLLLPLFKVVPPLYRWRMRSRIYRWYEELEDIDKESARQQHKSRAVLMEKLDDLEREVREVKVPLSFSYQLYHLRLHINFVRGRLKQDSLES